MITIISPLYPPANKGGGPIKSTSGVASILEKEGVAYKVITNNKDLDGEMLDKEEYMPNTIYLDKKNIFTLQKHLKNSNLIWFNTLYHVNFAFIPLVSLLFVKKTTVLITPRGQLLFGSISRKKKLYLKLFSFLLKISPHTIRIHYTHEDEKEKSYDCFANYPSVIFPNTLSGEIIKRDITDKNKNFTLGFFGRINPKKNIGFIINILPYLDKSISLQIHGVLEDLNYKKELDTLIEKYQLKDRVRFYGYYDKHSFIEITKNIDVIVIPSLSENFCHVFFESIEAKKVVIASNGLPWEEANKYVKKTILPLQNEQWIERLNELYRIPNETYKLEIKQLLQFYKDINLSIKKETIDNFKKLSN